VAIVQSTITGEWYYLNSERPGPEALSCAADWAALHGSILILQFANRTRSRDPRGRQSNRPWADPGDTEFNYAGKNRHQYRVAHPVLPQPRLADPKPQTLPSPSARPTIPINPDTPVDICSPPALTQNKPPSVKSSAQTIKNPSASTDPPPLVPRAHQFQ